MNLLIETALILLAINSFQCVNQKIMKTLNFTICIVWMFFTVSLYAQTDARVEQWEKDILNDENLSKKESKNSLIKYNFAPLWTRTENRSVLGFIGDNYQRIRVKIISAVKDKKNPDTYVIFGKSLVKDNLCAFAGTMKIDKARIYEQMHWGVDDEYKNRKIKMQGILLGAYRFSEKGCDSSGTFEGRFLTAWYLDQNGRINYDDIEIESDGYSNNQFAGIWKSKKGRVTKICNWGDYRIPLSGDLDLGAGEFSPDEKYLKFGWQNYRDAYLGNSQKARTEEERLWWK